jgi:glycosyltransferase involved in cell wall biosynthesis
LSGPVASFDAQALQSASYSERGVARYTLELIRALVARHPDFVGQVVLNPRLPISDRLRAELQGTPWTTEPSWERAGAVWIASSPFELDVRVKELWPRQTSRRGMKLAVIAYDLIPEVFPDIYLCEAGLRRRYRARHEIVRAADHVFAISRATADDLVSMLGIAPQRISVVRAAASSRFEPPASRRESLELARASVPGLGESFVVYNGGVEPRKNLERLLEAFALLPQSLRCLHQLVLVCKLDPLERHHFEVRAAQLSIPLLLTGYLPDEALVALYQSATLVVFPSLYEGFGLPVAEALACGAPVVASASSSLEELVPPEATFDPYDIEAIAAKLRDGLEDDRLRERLSEWARRPHTTWSGVADAVATACEQLASRGAPPASRWRKRPRLAVATPWPPARTGVAIYSERLVEALRRRVDVDVLVDGDEVAPGLQKMPVDLSLVEAAAGVYDAVVLTLGNSEHHAGALRALRQARRPVAVLLHDVRLTNLYLHGAARGAVPEGFEVAAGRLCPEGIEGCLMVKEVIALADRILVTSDFAAGLARSEADAAEAAKIHVWAYGYPDPRPRRLDAIEPGLVCCFGIVDAVKCPDVMIGALALMGDAGAARLVFVGPVDAELAARLLDMASRLGVADSVSFEGAVDDNTYDRWLQRASLAVQLRSQSNGESSAAVGDCLARGVPVVVSDCGAQSELPGFVAKVSVPLDTQEVARVVAGLLDDTERRRSMAMEGLAFVGQHGFGPAADDLLRLLDGLGV